MIGLAMGAARLVNALILGSLRCSNSGYSRI